MFYSSLFTTECPLFPANLDGLITPSISPSANISLMAIPSPEEIKNDVLNMSSHTSLGPDGFPPFFYKRFWPDLATTLITAVQKFFSTGFLLQEWNHTFIT